MNALEPERFEFERVKGVKVALLEFHKRKGSPLCQVRTDASLNQSSSPRSIKIGWSENFQVSDAGRLWPDTDKGMYI